MSNKMKEIKMGFYIFLLIALIFTVFLGCSNPANSQPNSLTENLNYTSPNIGTLVYIPNGSFQRDETATNISVITQPFRISQYQITRIQFLSIMGTDPSDADISTGNTNPVQMVNWYHAIAFANKLSIAEGLTQVYLVNGVDFHTLTYNQVPISSNTHWNAVSANWSANGYRLPTEMEWMWAAMGATSDSQPGAIQDGINRTGYAKPFAGYNGVNTIDNYAWFNVNSSDTTHPVGNRLANELGLYDMSGNVWEWNWDVFGETPSGTRTDYRGAGSGAYRIRHGGSWSIGASFNTIAIRSYNFPYLQSNFVGFRVVRP